MAQSWWELEKWIRGRFQNRQRVINFSPTVYQLVHQLYQLVLQLFINCINFWSTVYELFTNFFINILSTFSVFFINFINFSTTLYQHFINWAGFGGSSSSRGGSWNSRFVVGASCRFKRYFLPSHAFFFLHMFDPIPNCWTPALGPGKAHAATSNNVSMVESPGLCC